MSNMTLGTAQIGMNYGVANVSGKPGDEESLIMLESAVDGGITSIDTASTYGDSEARLGRFFQSPFFHGEPPYITTKLRVGIGATRQGGLVLSESELGQLTKEYLDMGAAAEKTVFQTVEQSLERLKLKKINCVMLHDPVEMRAGGKPLAKIMGKLVKAGYADEVGGSVYFPADVDALLSYDEYTATQLPMSIFDQKMIHSGALVRLYNNNFAVFVRSVFLQGLFFLDPDKDLDPILAEHAVPHIRTLRRLAQDEGVSIAQLAISFVRDTLGVTSLVLGCDTKAQLEENVKLMEGPAVSEKTMNVILNSFTDLHYEEIMTVLGRVKE